jgi:hypothetical protein
MRQEKVEKAVNKNENGCAVVIQFAKGSPNGPLTAVFSVDALSPTHQHASHKYGFVSFVFFPCQSPDHIYIYMTPYAMSVRAGRKRPFGGPRSGTDSSFKQLRTVEPSLQAHPTVSFPSKDLIFK